MSKKMWTILAIDIALWVILVYLTYYWFTH